MIKRCLNPKCQQDFQTEFTQKNYCSVRCRRTAKEGRAVERDGQRTFTTVVDDRRLITNPKIEQLAMMALLYAANAEQKPTFFTGEIPDWTPPTGVYWGWTSPEHKEKMMQHLPETPKNDIMVLFGQQQGAVTLNEIPAKTSTSILPSRPPETPTPTPTAEDRRAALDNDPKLAATDDD